MKLLRGMLLASILASPAHAVEPMAAIRHGWSEWTTTPNTGNNPWNAIIPAVGTAYYIPTRWDAVASVSAIQLDLALTGPNYLLAAGHHVKLALYTVNGNGLPGSLIAQTADYVIPAIAPQKNVNGSLYLPYIISVPISTPAIGPEAVYVAIKLQSALPLILQGNDGYEFLLHQPSVAPSFTGVPSTFPTSWPFVCASATYSTAYPNTAPITTSCPIPSNVPSNSGSAWSIPIGLQR
jgi:hypothetical protein